MKWKQNTFPKRIYVLQFVEYMQCQVDRVEAVEIDFGIEKLWDHGGSKKFELRDMSNVQKPVSRTWDNVYAFNTSEYCQTLTF
jgi:hypothetical protein